ncbi:MAG: FKBP-type peptidyl-prolyl cis-trans isomerase [Novosphingobium sp.]
MTEITRVPLQPIAKGAVGKLWLGVVAAVALGAGLAWATIPVSVTVVTERAGSGPSPTVEDVVLINYKGTLADGKVFDQGEKAPLQVAGVIPGFTKALEQMQKGGKYKVHIPASLGYGAKGGGPIPPNADLNFEIELIDFRSLAEIQQQQQMMQQMQQQMQGAAPEAGAPGAPPAGAPAPGR